MPFDGKEFIDPRIEILRRGRARIALGWHQGWDEEPIRCHWWQLWRKRETWCAETALEDNTELVVLLHAIGAPFGDEYDIYEWNDEQGRTKEQVLRLYDDAIASLATAE